jgi:hypothetical protein
MQLLLSPSPKRHWKAKPLCIQSSSISAQTSNAENQCDPLTVHSSHFRHEKALISEPQANRKLFPDHLPSTLHGGLVGAGLVWPTAKRLQGLSVHNLMESAATNYTGTNPSPSV